MNDDIVASTCFRANEDKVRQDAQMLEDYQSFMDGTPSDELVARLAAYNAAHPEARVAAALWITDRLGTVTGIWPVTVDVVCDAERLAASIGESLREYAAARAPAVPAPDHTKPMPARALGLPGRVL